MDNRGQLRILLIEDDDGHARLIERGLRKCGLTNPIERAADGQAALDYLFERANVGDPNGELPHLIFLDINLPRVDGIEVLERVKKHPRLGTIPVIMLTSTDTQPEIDRCYKAGANSYVAKPVNISELSEKLRRLGMFLEIVELPHI